MEQRTYLTKENLLEKAKKLAESEDVSAAIVEVNNLKRQWRRLGGDEESLYDKKMSDAFYGYIDQLVAKEAEVYASVEEKKHDIINKAKDLLNATNFRSASSKMTNLMNQWKLSGRSSKETDDELWNEFKAVRDEFYEKRTAYYESLEESYKTNTQLKEELIEKAKEANKSENFKELTAAMDALMEEWKKIGHAGKENEERLWKEFSAERKAFFKNKNAYYDNLKATYNQKVAAKKELIAEAKLYLARSEFTEEEVNAIKALRTKWKEIGYAGKDHDEELWNEFNTTLNTYFDNKKVYG